MMKLKEGAKGFFKEALFTIGEFLMVSVSLIIFIFLDLLDRLLCVVFWVLDSILDPLATPCYCRQRRNGALPEVRGSTLPTSHSSWPDEVDHVSESTNEMTSTGRSGGTSPDDIAFHVECNGHCLSPVMAGHTVDGEPSHTRKSQKIDSYDDAFETFSVPSTHAQKCASTESVARNNYVDLITTQSHFESHGQGRLFSYRNIFKKEVNKCWNSFQHSYVEKRYQPTLISLEKPMSFSHKRKSRKASTGKSISSLQSDHGFFKKTTSRWSDCSCSTCTSWEADEKGSLYVHLEGQGPQNVIFVHGFLSSSLMWSTEVIPYLSTHVGSTYRFLAVDLLGFGKSPKPRNCQYTMADQLKKIEDCVLRRYKIESFHLVGHSMGCLVALALAASHVGSVKTITLLAPPYFPAPENEVGASYVLRQVAPRRIWPLTAFGASVMSWYEHVGRWVCFALCKQHTKWEYIINILTFKRISRSAVRDFMSHTHHSAWHIFHNVICGEAHAMDNYLRKLEKAGCIIHVFHGKDDKVVSVQCSYRLHKEHQTTNLQVFDGVDHVTIIYGRELWLANELSRIWRMEEVK